MNKRGFTLMELLVYMAIVGIVVVIAGQVYSDSTKMRVRTQSMISANQVAEDVGALLKDDVGQMGTKMSHENASTTSDSFYVASKVYINAAGSASEEKDSSSYVWKMDFSGSGKDSLAFRKIQYDGNGHYVSVQQIAWFVRGTSLYRECRTIEGTASDECKKESPVAVEIASQVDSFAVIPSKPGVAYGQSARLLPSTDTAVHTFKLIPRYGEDDLTYLNVSPATGAASVSLSGFATNYDYSNESVGNTHYGNQVFLGKANATTSGDWKDLCEKVSLDSNTEYEISFEMPYSANASRMFCPGRDYMAVGFRSAVDGSAIEGLDDFMFYPPAMNTASTIRSMRFTVPRKVALSARNVCMGFSFASYSPVAAGGVITLSEVKLQKVEYANYKFERFFNFNTIDKKNVKAFRIVLVVKKNKEAGRVDLFIPVPSNGVRS